MPNASQPPPLALPAQFGPFVFDSRSGELARDGHPVHLRRQAADVLVALLERPGALVTREEIRGRIWGDLEHGSFDQGLHDAVTDLRAALGDAAGASRYVETLPRRGYRFIAALAHAAPLAPQPPARDPAGPRRPHAGLLGAALAVVLVASMALSSTGPEPRIRVAVLPFHNVAGPDDALSEGLTDELSAQLGSLEPAAFAVIGATTARRYRDRPAADLGRDLRVGFVVTGSIRRDDDRARISVQLVDTRTETAVWAQLFDVRLGDLLGVQSEIAFAVSRRARVSVSARARPARSLDRRAEASFLRARQLWRTRQASSVREALSLLQGAASREPDYAPIHSAMADALNVLADVGDGARAELLARARSEAERAIALDDSMADGHAALGASGMLGSGGWRWAATEACLRRALALNPNHASARQWLSAVLRFQGRHREAIAEARLAAALDPESPAVLLNLANALAYAGEHEAARQEFQRVLQIEPGFAAAWRGLSRAEIQQRHPERALSAARQARFCAPDDLEYVVDLGYALAVSGNAAAARGELKRLKAQSERWPYGIAIIHSALRENEEAMRWLRRAIELGDPSLRVLAIDGRVDALRGRPGFAQLLQATGFSATAGG